MRFKVHKLDHFEFVEDVYDDVHCSAFYWPHRDMAMAFSEWWFEHGGQEAFLEYRGPVIESVDDIQHEEDEDD